MLFERIQNSRRAAVLVARVKRQVDGLSARVTDVKRVVLPQFLGGDIADRRLTLGLERQSPVADRRGNRLFGGCRSGMGLGGLQAAARGGGLPAGRRDACSREDRGGLSADDYAWRAASSRSRSAIEHPVASSRTSRW